MKQELLILFSIFSVAYSYNCYVQGQCTNGNLIDLTPVLDDSGYNTCLDFCKSYPNCNNFTYNHDTLTCFAFETCPDVTTENCVDCRTGERNCSYYRQCGEHGQCTGGFLTAGAADNEYGCMAMCHDTSGCLYYTYYSDNNMCVILSSCTTFDTTCSDCVSGEVTCGNVNPGKLNMHLDFPSKI